VFSIWLRVNPSLSFWQFHRSPVRIIPSIQGNHSRQSNATSIDTPPPRPSGRSLLTVPMARKWPSEMPLYFPQNRQTAISSLQNESTLFGPLVFASQPSLFPGECFMFSVEGLFGFLHIVLLYDLYSSRSLLRRLLKRVSSESSISVFVCAVLKSPLPVCRMLSRVQDVCTFHNQLFFPSPPTSGETTPGIMPVSFRPIQDYFGPFLGACPLSATFSPCRPPDDSQSYALPISVRFGKLTPLSFMACPPHPLFRLFLLFVWAFSPM